MLQTREDSDLELRELMERTMWDTPVPPDLSTFEDYKREHPEFFID